VKRAEYGIFSPYGTVWKAVWGHDGSCDWSWNTAFYKSKITSSTRSIPIARSDYYYAKYGGNIEIVSVATNTAASTTSVFAMPEVYSDVFTRTESKESCALETPLYAEVEVYRWITYSSTNNLKSVTDSALYTNVNMHTIHKWDVTRCVPE
jgi:hypothetical protein